MRNNLATLKCEQQPTNRSDDTHCASFCPIILRAPSGVRGLTGTISGRDARQTTAYRNFLISAMSSLFRKAYFTPLSKLAPCGAHRKSLPPYCPRSTTDGSIGCPFHSGAGRPLASHAFL